MRASQRGKKRPCVRDSSSSPADDVEDTSLAVLQLLQALALEVKGLRSELKSATSELKSTTSELRSAKEDVLAKVEESEQIISGEVSSLQAALSGHIASRDTRPPGLSGSAGPSGPPGLSGPPALSEPTLTSLGAAHAAPSPVV